MAVDVRCPRDDAGRAVGDRLVERLVLEQRAGECLEPITCAVEEVDDFALGVDDPARLVIDDGPVEGA